MTDRADVSFGSTSLSLLDRVRVHEADAWVRFADLYGPLVYRWARQSQLQSSDAADVVQEVFRSVAENIRSFRRDRPRDSLRAWLRAITRNKVKDHFRKRKSGAVGIGGSDHVFDLMDELVSTDDESGQSGLPQLAHRALETVRCEFEASTWRAFWRVVVDDQKPADVAAELGMTLGAVYMAKSRVRKRLRSELEGLFD